MHLGIAKCNMPFFGHCDFDFGLVSRIIMLGAYLLHYLREESKIWLVDTSWDGGVSHTIITFLAKAGLVMGLFVHTFGVPSLCNL